MTPEFIKDFQVLNDKISQNKSYLSTSQRLYTGDSYSYCEAMRVADLRDAYHMPRLASDSQNIF